MIIGGKDCYLENFRFVFFYVYYWLFYGLEIDENDYFYVYVCYKRSMNWFDCLMGEFIKLSCDNDL